MGRHEGRASAAGADLVVESTDVQGCVPGGILGSRLSSVEKQVFQVLGVAPLTGLVDFLPAILVRDAQLGPVVQKQLAASGIAPHHSRVEQRGQPTAVLVVGGAPEVQECRERQAVSGAGGLV